MVTTTSDEYAVSFGFTQEEVFKALDDMGLGGEKQGVKQWYDGFTFGAYTDIYNPWSIASFIRKGGKYAAYWSNTSGNGLVNSLIQKGNIEVKQITEELLKGRSFEASIDEQILFEFKVLDVDDDEASLEDTLANAHKQIREKKYEAELATILLDSDEIVR